MTHVTCRLTAKNRVQLPNPTLGYRVWATFTFLSVLTNKIFIQNIQNASVGVEDVCPPRVDHAGAPLRYVVAKFNFSHVQTPFIVAAWILFVTLAKIGGPTTTKPTCRLLSSR